MGVLEGDCMEASTCCTVLKCLWWYRDSRVWCVEGRLVILRGKLTCTIMNLRLVWADRKSQSNGKEESHLQQRKQASIRLKFPSNDNSAKTTGKSTCSSWYISTERISFWRQLQRSDCKEIKVVTGADFWWFMDGRIEYIRSLQQWPLQLLMWARVLER